MGDLVAEIPEALVAEVTGDLVAGDGCRCSRRLGCKVTGDLLAEGTLDDLKIGFGLIVVVYCNLNLCLKELKK